MGFIGLGTLEFAKDINSGKYYFLEINGRSYYHNKLFTDCNKNLSYIAYCDAVGLKIEDLTDIQKEGLIWIDFSRDLASFTRKHKKNEIKAIEWLRSIIRARSFAVFDKYDLLPFIYSTFLFLRHICEKAYMKFNK
jgi:predicted ATP-grasp superfamily ATP-dependent carboligase